MKHPRIEEHLLESAWMEVETEFGLAGMADPAPGFTSRFQQRLAKHQAGVEKRQAWFIFAVNTVIAFGFLGMIGLRFVPDLPMPNQLFSTWVDVLSRLIVFVNIAFRFLETFVKTIPAVLPASWLASIIGSMGAIVLLWGFQMRKYVRERGV